MEAVKPTDPKMASENVEVPDLLERLMEPLVQRRAGIVVCKNVRSVGAMGVSGIGDCIRLCTGRCYGGLRGQMEAPLLYPQIKHTIQNAQRLEQSCHRRSPPRPRHRRLHRSGSGTRHGLGHGPALLTARSPAQFVGGATARLRPRRTRRRAGTTTARSSTRSAPPPPRTGGTGSSRRCRPCRTRSGRA